MDIKPKGEPKVKIEYEGTVNGMPWMIDFAVQAIVAIVVFAVILNRPEWIAWLLSWLPER